MRIVIADYSGHPFQVQLSRELARSGHSILHLHFAEFQTPKGRLTIGPDDPDTLAIEPISLGNPFAKQNLIKRRFQEVAVGKLFAARISKFNPDAVIASNLPLDTLRIVAQRSRSEKRAFVFWQQDIYSIAIERIMRHRLGALGTLIGKYYKGVERDVLRECQAIIAISEDFLPYLHGEFGVVSDKISVVENWAPLDEITPRSKDNPWSHANRLMNKEVVLYSGTLGMKHDPGQLLSVAKALRNRPNTEVVIASEGPAAEWLSEKAQELDLPSLRVIGFQPFSVYPDMLGSADVLISILEAESGAFSVPSKVLSYLCAGRAIVLSAPRSNLAARTVTAAGAGKVVPAGNTNELVASIRAFLDTPSLRDMAGRSGRQYAEKVFDIGAIGARFQNILEKAQEANLKRSCKANCSRRALQHDASERVS